MNFQITLKFQSKKPVTQEAIADLTSEISQHLMDVLNAQFKAGIEVVESEMEGQPLAKKAPKKKTAKKAPAKKTSAKKKSVSQR